MQFICEQISYIFKYNLLGLDRLERSIDSTNKMGLGLFSGSFIVSRIDKREMKADLDILRNKTKEEMRAADLNMDRTTVETRLYNTFTLLIAVSAVLRLY